MNKELIGAKANLSFYIKQDPFFNGTYEVESDFDKYCYEHCKDIETVLNYIEELEEKNSKLLDEQTATYMNDKELQESVNRLVNKNFIPRQVILDKIEEIENIKLCGGKVTQVVAEEEIQVLQEILKGENNENI